MTVVVAYKWAANPQDAAVDETGAVSWSRAAAAVSEYDPVAIAVGRTLATSTGSELVGASIGTSAVASSMAAKAAMSRGLDRGMVVADDSTSSWNATQVAGALATLVERLGSASVLLTGDASVDEGARSISALVAGFLGWVCFQDVVDVVGAEGAWTVTQSVPGGTRTITVRGPAVLAVTSDAVVPPVPGMRDILSASKKPFEVVALAELDVPQVDLSITGRTRPAPRARKHEVFTGSAADVVAEALAAMRADAAL